MAERKRRLRHSRPDTGERLDATTIVVNGIRRLDRGLRLAARDVQRATGLSAAQLFVLEQLVNAPGASVNELAALTFTDRSSVSAVVDRLAAAGLATRAPARDDRRRADVRITPAGRAILHRAPPAPTMLLLSGLRRLSRTSLKQLGVTLSALNETLGFHEADMLFAGESE
jgi:DNA-binding MarR family transcriptional regulator